jgi:hypothetical protein
VPRTGSSRPRRGRTAPGRRERVRRGRAALGHAPRRTMVGRAGAAQGAAPRRAVRRARAHHATPGRGGRATRRARATPGSHGQAAPCRAARQGSAPGGLGRAQSREPRRGAMAGPRQGKKEEQGEGGRSVSPRRTTDAWRDVGRATELDGGLHGREARTSELRMGERKACVVGVRGDAQGRFGALTGGPHWMAATAAGQPLYPHRPGERAAPHALAAGPPNQPKVRRGGWAAPGEGLRARAGRERLGRAGHWPGGPRGGGRIGWAERGKGERGEKVAAGPRQAGSRARGFFSYFPIFLFVTLASY